MNLNLLTYVSFALGCALLSTFAEAKPTLSAGAARELQADSPWIAAVEEIIEEKARDGEDNVLITNLPCRKIKALKDAGYELKSFKEGRCLISWAEAEMKEQKVKQDEPIKEGEPEKRNFKLDYLTYRLPR
jgi:hypothetical protein